MNYSWFFLQVCLVFLWTTIFSVKRCLLLKLEEIKIAVHLRQSFTMWTGLSHIFVFIFYFLCMLLYLLNVSFTSCLIRTIDLLCKSPSTYLFRHAFSRLHPLCVVLFFKTWFLCSFEAWRATTSCRWVWPWTHRGLSASDSLEFRLKMCATTTWLLLSLFMLFTV